MLGGVSSPRPLFGLEIDGGRGALLCPQVQQARYAAWMFPRSRTAWLLVLLSVAGCRQIASYGGPDAAPIAKDARSDQGEKDALTDQQPDLLACGPQNNCPTTSNVCGTYACIAGRCQLQVSKAGQPCRPSADPCDPAETCDGNSSECPPDHVLHLERYHLRATTAATLRKDSAAIVTGPHDSKIDVGCAGGDEYRGFLTFATERLPPNYQLMAAALSLCAQSAANPPVDLELWSGSFNLPLSSSAFDATTGKVTNGTVVTTGPFSLNGLTATLPTSPTRLILRTAATCPAGQSASATFVTDKTTTSVGSCGNEQPQLDLDLCRDSAGLGPRCATRDDCLTGIPLIPPCVTVQCIDGHCANEAGQKGWPCGGTGTPCDPKRFCDGETPSCPPAPPPHFVGSQTFVAKPFAAATIDGVTRKVDYNQVRPSLDGVLETRGVVIFDTTPIPVGSVVQSAQVYMCLSLGDANVEVRAAALTGSVEAANFDAIAGPPVALLTGSKVGPESPTLDRAAVQVAGFSGLVLKVKNSVGSAFLAQRVYAAPAAASNGPCSGNNDWTLTVSYCKP